MNIHTVHEKCVYLLSLLYVVGMCVCVCINYVCVCMRVCMCVRENMYVRIIM